MTRNQALHELEKLFSTVGFSYFNVRAVMNKVYDSLENNGSLKNKINEKALIEGTNKLPVNNPHNIPSTKPDSLNLITKKFSNKKERLSYCSDYFKDLETKGYDVKVHKTHIDIIHKTHNLVKYFPLSDRLQICKNNTWHNEGFSLITKNLQNINKK